MADSVRREVRIKAIVAARERLKPRRRGADLERGRSEGDKRKPHDEDGKPKGGYYKREFGEPEPKAQDNFTDPDGRVMKRTVGAFDASYSAHMSVYDTAHIIVAAELGNNAANVGQPLAMRDVFKTNTGQTPAQALADAGNCNGASVHTLAGSATELVMAHGREAKDRIAIDAKTRPHADAMPSKLQTEVNKAAFRRRTHVAKPPNG